MINILNWKLGKKAYTRIKCGIGIAQGRALMVKTGHRGSSINEIAWMGNVVNEAAHLCHQGNRENRAAIQLSKQVYSQLSVEYQKLVEAFTPFLLLDIANYEGMEAWLANERYKSRKIGFLEPILGKPIPPTPDLLNSVKIIRLELESQAL